MDNAPAWVSKKAFLRELNVNWEHGYDKVKREYFHRNLNFITSHFVHKLKENDNRNLKQKYIMVIHGNKYLEN